MPRNDFAAIRTWVFDLDNALYPPEMALFSQIERRMTDWVMAAIGVERDQADRLRRDYWARYGTTLAGLMAEHDVDPAPYLSHVHDIDLDHVVADPDLTAALTALPGRKIVYTNGSSRYGLRVLEARGLGAVFDAVYGVEHATGWTPAAPPCSRMTRETSPPPTTWECAPCMSPPSRWLQSTSTTIPTIWQVFCGP